MAQAGIPLSERCVFCSGKTVSPNREHPIPRWLLRLTGDPNRSGSFEFLENGKLKRVNIKWRDFCVPSCESCNHRYGEALENKISRTMRKLLDNSVLDKKELRLLANWLDKVRVGLWWYILRRSGNPLNIPATFGVEERVEKKDRLFRITRIKECNTGMSLNGYSSFAFMFMPSALGIRINELIILSISAEFILSKAMGFPYPVKILHLGEGVFEAEMEEGTGKVEMPVFDLSGFPGETFFQSIAGGSGSKLMHIRDGHLVPFKKGKICARAINIHLWNAIVMQEIEVRTIQNRLALSHSYGSTKDISDLVIEQNKRRIELLLRNLASVENEGRQSSELPG
jgi:hypothetical protein